MEELKYQNIFKEDRLFDAFAALKFLKIMKEIDLKYPRDFYYEVEIDLDKPAYIQFKIKADEIESDDICGCVLSSATSNGMFEPTLKASAIYDNGFVNIDIRR